MLEVTNKMGEIEKSTLPLAALDDGPFEPSDRQRGARAACRQLVDQGFASPIDWLQELAVRASGKQKPLMTSEEWREWQGDEKFEQWFYDKMFPTPSRHALKGLWDSWMAGLDKSLKKGDPATIKWFHDKMEAGSDGDGDNLVDALKQQARSNSWRD